VGGVNPAIQLAAALDRRGISVSLDYEWVVIHIQGQERIVVGRRTEGVKPYQIGREWAWSYADEWGVHPVKDYEGAAEAIEEMLRSIPSLAETALLWRMDFMGLSFEQESQARLERLRARKK
jgi:hypothetical protein